MHKILTFEVPKNGSRSRDIRCFVTNNNCWEVISHSLDKDGYANFQFEGKKLKIHRYMYQKYVGIIPTGYGVCHECDNPKCCNPTHLFAGNQSDNVNDCISKGRFTTGEKSHASILTLENVRNIRNEYGEGKISHRRLSYKYGVSESEIRRILSGQRWRHDS